MSESSELERFNAAIDEALEGGEFDDSTTARLQEILSESIDAGVSVVALMHLVAHPVVAEALAQGEVPTPLVGSISQALHVSLDMFSEWTGAPLLIQLERLEREYRREKKTFEVVRGRVSSADDEAATAIVERYLNSEPSAFFATRLEAEFPEVVDKVERDNR